MNENKKPKSWSTQGLISDFTNGPEEEPPEVQRDRDILTILREKFKRSEYPWKTNPKSRGVND